MGSTTATKKIFLGGTANGSKWREELIPQLTNDYYNPDKGANWTQKDYEEELVVRATADILLYVITPKMTGVYSIAEVVDDSNKRPSKTVFYIKEKDSDETGEFGFTEHQLKALKKVGEMVEANTKGKGGTWCKTWDELVAKLNS